MYVSVHTNLSDGELIQASEKSPVSLKIVLLEYLGTNRSAPDSMDMIPFLLDRIKHEPHDKTRACAVLALGIMFRFVFIATVTTLPLPMGVLLVALSGGEKTNAIVRLSMRYGNGPKLQDARKLLAEFWGGESDTSNDEKLGSSDGGDVVMTHEDTTVGPLTKVILALVALQQLAHPPLMAVDHALVALTDYAIPAAWQSVRGTPRPLYVVCVSCSHRCTPATTSSGGNLFLSEVTEVTINNLVSKEFLALPLVQKQLADYCMKVEEYNERKMRFMPAKSTVPTLSVYGLCPASFAEVPPPATRPTT
jgi:hypothetical protein